MLFTDEGETQASIQEKYDSHQWWIIPGLSEEASEFMTYIEKTFYKGKKNADFELVIGLLPPPFFTSIAFAKKNRLPPPRLARALLEYDGSVFTQFSYDDLLAAVSHQDVLIVIPVDGDEHVYSGYMQLLNLWLGGEDTASMVAAWRKEEEARAVQE